MADQARSRFPGSLYLSPRFFWAVGAVVVLILVGYFFPTVAAGSRVALFGLLAALVADILLLYRAHAAPNNGEALQAVRETPRRLSNGDFNEIRIGFTSRYTIPTTVRVLDELPVQFQSRTSGSTIAIPARGTAEIVTRLRPVARGEYSFGVVNAFVETQLGLAQRRFRTAEPVTVPVYPSFVQMRKYALMAISDRLTEVGVKKIRRIGNTMEFDQIRSYVRGDDIRTVNWKATARATRLMVNQYRDERAQQIVSVVDMGRTMKLPFEEMTLLDYAINAALALSNVSIGKEDKAGLITFSDTVQSIVRPARSNDQLQRILENLYRQKTGFTESSFERLAASALRVLSHRSLLMLYTNFESLNGMRRQLPYLRALARRHLVLVIIFENTELRSLLAEPQKTIEGIYVKTVAERFAREKREIVGELKQYGIDAVLTAPQELTVSAINAYLRLKAARRI